MQMGAGNFQGYAGARYWVMGELLFIIPMTSLQGPHSITQFFFSPEPAIDPTIYPSIP